MPLVVLVNEWSTGSVSGLTRTAALKRGRLLASDGCGSSGLRDRSTRRKYKRSLVGCKATFGYAAVVDEHRHNGRPGLAYVQPQDLVAGDTQPCPVGVADWSARNGRSNSRAANIADRARSSRLCRCLAIPLGT